MVHIIVRHKVADFAKWKPVYEDHRSMREAAGIKDQHLWRNADDPNEIILLFEAPDMAKAKEFADSTDLKEKMQAAGVQGAPEFVFLTNG
jgi:hypothetical protein